MAGAARRPSRSLHRGAIAGAHRRGADDAACGVRGYSSCGAGTAAAGARPAPVGLYDAGGDPRPDRRCRRCCADGGAVRIADAVGTGLRPRSGKLRGDRQCGRIDLCVAEKRPGGVARGGRAVAGSAIAAAVIPARCRQPGGARRNRRWIQADRLFPVAACVRAARSRAAAGARAFPHRPARG